MSCTALEPIMFLRKTHMLSIVTSSYFVLLIVKEVGPHHAQEAHGVIPKLSPPRRQEKDFSPGGQATVDMAAWRHDPSDDKVIDRSVPLLPSPRPRPLHGHARSRMSSRRAASSRTRARAARQLHQLLPAEPPTRRSSLPHTQGFGRVTMWPARSRPSPTASRRRCRHGGRSSLLCSPHACAERRARQPLNLCLAMNAARLMSFLHDFPPRFSLDVFSSRFRRSRS